MDKNLYIAIIEVLALIIISLFAVVEAYLFHYKSKSNEVYKTPPLHYIFTTQRIIMIVGWFLMNKTIPTDNLILLAGSLILQFPMIHDGVYYKTRNYLDRNIYVEGFWDESETSTAILEFTTPVRIMFFLCGCAMLVGALVINRV